MNEVAPNRKSELVELADLKDSIPAAARTKIEEVEKLSRAWDLLDKLYGDKSEL